MSFHSKWTRFPCRSPSSVFWRWRVSTASDRSETVVVKETESVTTAHMLFISRRRIWQDLHWGTWNLVPWPGVKPGPSVLGARSLSHWTTRTFLNDSLQRADGQQRHRESGLLLCPLWLSSSFPQPRVKSCGLWVFWVSVYSLLVSRNAVTLKSCHQVERDL